MEWKLSRKSNGFLFEVLSELKEVTLKKVWQFVFPITIGILVSGAQIGSAQSLKVQNPTTLSAGVNRATVDSFVGPHYWSSR
ncbi:hypothetical protein ABTC87_18430, partial [Acinetobacter baumannii]